MFDIKLSALNIKSTEYNESDKILTLFSPEKGLLSARIKGVKKAQAKLKFAAEPFCCGEYELTSSKNAQYIVTGCSQAELFYPIRQDLSRFYAGSAVLEFCLMFVQEGESSEELFNLSVNALHALSSLSDSAATLAWYLIHALKAAGYALTLDSCNECGRELLLGDIVCSIKSYGFLCPACGGASAKKVPQQVTDCVKILSASTLEGVSALKFAAETLYMVTKLASIFINNIAGSYNKSLKEFNAITK